MKRIFLYILPVFTLLSCRNSENRFSLSGEFDHLQQGEFYIYSPEGAIDHLDTIQVTDGSFEYHTTLKGKATFMLLYPNYSEHVIFAEGGKEVKIKGDAQKLGEAEISGTPENEEMTRFRIENLKKDDPGIIQAAENHIRKNPSSDVSTFLFKEYFLAGQIQNPQKVKELYQILLQAQPDQTRLKMLQGKVNGLAASAVGEKLPAFQLPAVQGESINTDKLKGKVTLISFWANWRNSGYIIYQLRKLKNKYGNKLGLISFSLDINPKILEGSMERDSISWPVFCDYKAWDNPLLQKLGVYDIPYHILIDADQRILVRSGNLDKDILPEIEKKFN